MQKNFMLAWWYVVSGSVWLPASQPASGHRGGREGRTLLGPRDSEVWLVWAVMPEPAATTLFGTPMSTPYRPFAVPRWWENRYHQPRHPVPSAPPLPLRGCNLLATSRPPSSPYGASSATPLAPALHALALATVPFQASLSMHPNLLSAYRTFRRLRILFLDPRNVPRRYNLTTPIPCSAGASGPRPCALASTGLTILNPFLPSLVLSFSPHLSRLPRVRSVVLRPRLGQVKDGMRQLRPDQFRLTHVAQLHSCAGGADGA